MSNSQALRKWLNAKAIGSHHRQILIIELPLGESLSILDEIYKHYPNINVMANEFTHFTATTNIHIHKYQQFLGSETDALIFDASSGVNLNALYAGVGMVKANGIVAVILNSHEVNSQGALKFSYGQQDSYSYFTELFKKRVLQTNGCLISNTLTILPSSHVKSNKNKPLLLLDINEKRNKKRNFATKTEHINMSVAQSDIAKDIINCIGAKPENSTSVSVILGARGRGKSTLLGIIAAKLKHHFIVNQGSTCVATCALHKNQLQNLNLAFGKETDFILGDQHADFSPHINDKDDTLRFYAPDEIISSAPINSIVLLDEIASLAPELVKKIISHFSHIIVTGTSFGYEGSGNGFVKRLLPFLHSIKNTKVYELNAPFRWLKGDHIEACFNEILSPEIALSAGTKDDFNANILENVHFRVLNNVELIENRALYNQIFALLTQAHYQTTPNDVVRTLDASDCKIFVTEQTTPKETEKANTIIAVAIAFEEGGKLLGSLAQDISIGKRRVQGHLSAQALSLHLFSPEICTNSYLRINRIAVVDKHNRKGVASALLHYCEDYALTNNIDYMSVSFGYTQGLYKFWQNNDFRLAKIGQRIDTASGTASLLMIKNISNTGNINYAELSNRNVLDIDYYIEISSGTNHLVNEIKTTNNFTKEPTIQLDKILQQVLSLYLSKQINFQKFAPGLLGIINYWCDKLSTEQLKSIQEIFRHLHKKGVHKEAKETLETLLFEILERLIILNRK